MKKIKITERNEKLYQELYSIKIGNQKSNWKIDLLVALSIVIVIAMITGTCILVHALYSGYAIADLILSMITVLGILSVPTAILKLRTQQKIRKFKKNHPEINTKTSTKELRKQLVKYKRFSEKIERIKTVPENVVIEQLNKQTEKDRLYSLLAEREFWEQEKQKEVQEQPKHLDLQKKY